MKKLMLLSMVMSILLSASPSGSAEVIIVGDIRLKPISDMVKAITKSLPYYTSTHLLAKEERLAAVVEEERAKVVVALGKDALQSSLKLPETVSVIYSMLVALPEITRENTTGIYLETPIMEYISILKKYFPDIESLGVIYDLETEKFQEADLHLHIYAFMANNSYEFVNALRFADHIDALLLLPDINLLSSTAIKEVYLFSFRNKIPLLGISEKNVKEGSLFALVFDPSKMGRQIGRMTKAVLQKGDAGSLSPSPPEKFNLYINKDTAKKMNINIPNELSRKAKEIYP